MNILQRFFNRKRFKRKIKKDESCNVVDGIVKARSLYKELISKAHPDRHPQKIDIAKDLTQRINNNRYNYKVLVALKEEVNDKLF